MDFTKLYANTSSAPRTDAENYLNEYIHLLQWKPYKENILDVGCGDGSVTMEILYPHVRNHLKKLLAVDLSAPMIHHATNNNDLEEISFDVMDISKDDGLEDMKETFDHIFSFYCTHWVLDQRALMERFYKILTLGGQIFITTLADSSFHKTFSKIESDKKWSQFLPTTGFTNFTAKPIEFMKNLLEEIGFTVELCICENKASPVLDFIGFIESIAWIHPFINYIPKELQVEYVRDFVNICCEFSIPIEKPNKYKWPYSPLVYVATKKNVG